MMVKHRARIAEMHFIVCIESVGWQWASKTGREGKGGWDCDCGGADGRCEPSSAWGHMLRACSGCASLWWEV